LISNPKIKELYELLKADKAVGKAIKLDDMKFSEFRNLSSKCKSIEKILATLGMNQETIKKFTLKEKESANERILLLSPKEIVKEGEAYYEDHLDDAPFDYKNPETAMDLEDEKEQEGPSEIEKIV
jgi:hypothetical protein